MEPIKCSYQEGAIGCHGTGQEGAVHQIHIKCGSHPVNGLCVCKYEKIYEGQKAAIVGNKKKWREGEKG